MYVYYIYRETEGKGGRERDIFLTRKVSDNYMIKGKHIFNSAFNDIDKLCQGMSTSYRHALYNITVLMMTSWPQLISCRQ